MLEVFWDNLFKITQDEDIRLIKSCPLFSQLNAREVAFIKKLFHKRNYIAGEIVFKPLSGMGMYMILKGKVNILHGFPDSEDEPTVISSLKQGDFFGELALIQNKVYQNIFAQAATDSQMLALFKPDLDMILENRPIIGNKILKQLCEILSRRLQKAEQKILQAHAGK